MYLHTRIGRGLGLTTRVGPLTALFFLLPAIMVDLAKIVYLSIAFTASVVVALSLIAIRGWQTYRASHPSPSQRKALVLPLLREAVTVTSQDVLEQGLETYAVYAVRHRFFSGPFPATGAQLAKLFPDEVGDFVTVGLYATAPTARTVSTTLRHLGFSAGELRRLFGVRSTGQTART